MATSVKIGVSTVRLDLSRLRRLEKELGRHYVVRVGVLGSDTDRTKAVEGRRGRRRAGKEPADQTNAAIGLVHERGSYSRNIPARSFIKMPLELKLPYIFKKIGQKAVDSLVAGTVRKLYVELGVLAENIVQGAFATRGYGRWRENAPATVKRKGSSMPLIDTAQLRKSISSKVVTT